MNQDVEETELVIRTANGDRKAFTVLYSRHLHQLYRYIYLFTKSKDKTEEIIQSVFVKIWERRENLEHITFFKAYLYRSAKNLLLDEIRRNQLEAKAAILLKPATEESQEYSDQNLIYNQYYQIAQDAINLLPEKRKKIVELRTKDDLTLDEIAAELSISKGVVKKQLYAGKSFIREYLQKHAEFTSVLMLFHFFFK
ncbi:MAG: RNA polymerase sigma factor [Sphingobacteriaceae bacterium]